MNRETKRAMARQQRTTTEQGERLAEFRREQAVRQRETVQAPKRGGPRGIATFYGEVVAELKKVVWPTRRTVAGYTVVVLVFVSAITAVIFCLDWLFGKAVLQLYT